MSLHFQFPLKILLPLKKKNKECFQYLTVIGLLFLVTYRHSQDILRWLKHHCSSEESCNPMLSSLFPHVVHSSVWTGFTQHGSKPSKITDFHEEVVAYRAWVPGDFVYLQFPSVISSVLGDHKNKLQTSKNFIYVSVCVIHV